jgi:serine/threonine-protein kinase
VAEDKRTKIGPTGPVRAQPTPASATPVPIAPTGTPAPYDPATHPTSYEAPTSTPASTPAPGLPHGPPPPGHYPDLAPTDPSKHATSYLPPQMDPLLGQTLAGRYLIARKLGEGGMGAVYLATHMLLEKQVALKILHNEFARKPDLVERFMQEAKAASRIRHENVIDISDFGTTPEGLVFFAMELLQGHDLHEEVARARLAGQLLPYERSKKIFLQICSALSAAHSKGIIHRDLKPENVYLIDFLGDADFVKLLDFGIAKLTEVSENDRKLTKTGMLFGTPEYMSPEQARGENQVDHRVDVYAMGCILFQLVTGRVPFEADNFMGVLSLHLTEPPPQIPYTVFDLIGAPRELASVIDKALAKDRAARWQTIDELANAVRAVSGEAPVDAAARRGTGASTAARAASVPAPAVTKEARTPTPPPMTATATDAAVRQKTQWTGSLNVPHAADDLPPQPRSKLPFIIGGVLIAGAAATGVYFATHKGTDDKIVEPSGGTGTASGTGAVVTVTPDAPPAPPLPPVPQWSEVKLDSLPHGAEVTDLTTGRVLGKTPRTLKVPGSHTARQFQFVLRGYSDVIFELVPELPKIDHTETLEKGVSGIKPVVKTVGSGSGSATKPPNVGSGSGSGSATSVKPPDPVKPDAGVAQPPPDECPELPCGIKAFHDAGS